MIKKIVLLTLIFSALQLQAQKVLFIGNSLTYENNMPFILEKIGANFQQKIETEMVCFPNYALTDHLQDGKVQYKIANGNYDYVIIQQGPSSQNLGRKMLVEAGKILNEICKKSGTILGYYMVWPAKKYYFTFDKVIKNHTEASLVNNALLFKVGTNWKQFNALKNVVSLYKEDHFHPNKSGSLLAALTIFKELHPHFNLEQIRFRKVRSWISSKTSFNKMIDLIQNE